MRIETTTRELYTFDELTEEAQHKAIESLYDINVDYEWWDCVYEDAERAFLKITDFDFAGSYCHGSLMHGAEDTAVAILTDHGAICETYQTAKQYSADRSALVRKYAEPGNPERVAEGKEWDFDQECDELDAEFLKSILEDYRAILRREYEYLTGEEAIMDTIRANGYEFTADGELA
jgi:hypothetical protein